MTTNELVAIPFRQDRQPQSDSAKPSLEWQKFKSRVRRLKCWWLRPHTAYQPLFVVATCRSGSNLLLDYIRKLPGVQSLKEILYAGGPYGPRHAELGPDQALRHIRYSLQTLRSTVRGCKLMLYQLANCRLTLDKLDAAFPQARYIILYRQSLGEQFVSQQAAYASQQWVLLKGQQRKQPRVTVDPAELHRFCDAVRRGYREILAHPWLPEQAVLLSYEELTSDPARVLEQGICPLLGVPPTQPQTMLQKQNTLPFSERVENYRAVAAQLNSPLCQQYYTWPGRQAARRRAA